MRVVISGKMPPPVGGQNLNIERFFRLLGEIDGIEPLYWEWGFTKDWRTGRRGSFGKLWELFRVMGRLVRLRAGGRLDYILYSTGGPHTVPIIRDLLLLPFACLFARRVCVHFQAAGIARRLPEIPGVAGWLLRLVHRSCYGAVVLTEFGRADAEALGFERIDVIGNGVEDEAAGGVDEAAGGHSSGAPCLLSVGHLCGDKGTPALVAACGALRRRGHEISLKLVGECLPPYSEEQLGEDIRGAGMEGRVERAGVVRGEALWEAWGQGDLFVFSSVAPYESFGLVLVEAMMLGKPVVVTDWRANAEVFGRGEPAGGVIVSEDESLALEGRLVEALEEALEKRGEWGEWGKRNRERYEACYSIDVLRSNLERYFLETNGGD